MKQQLATVGAPAHAGIFGGVDDGRGVSGGLKHLAAGFDFSAPFKGKLKQIKILEIAGLHINVGAIFHIIDGYTGQTGMIVKRIDISPALGRKAMVAINPADKLAGLVSIVGMEKAEPV